MLCMWVLCLRRALAHTCVVPVQCCGTAFRNILCVVCLKQNVLKLRHCES